MNLECEATETIVEARQFVHAQGVGAGRQTHVLVLVAQRCVGRVFGDTRCVGVAQILVRPGVECVARSAVGQQRAAPLSLVGQHVVKELVGCVGRFPELVARVVTAKQHIVVLNHLGVRGLVGLQRLAVKLQHVGLSVALNPHYRAYAFNFLAWTVRTPARLDDAGVTVVGEGGDVDVGLAVLGHAECVVIPCAEEVLCLFLGNHLFFGPTHVGKLLPCGKYLACVVGRALEFEVAYCHSAIYSHGIYAVLIQAVGLVVVIRMVGGADKFIAVVSLVAAAHVVFKPR